VLDQLLTSLDVRVKAFAVCQTCPGWRLSFGPDEVPSIHYVLFGSGSINVSDSEPIALARDTLTVLPKRLPHAFENSGGRRREVLRQHITQAPGGPLPTIRAGDPVEGEKCLIVVCGRIQASFGGGLGLLDHLQHPLTEGFADQPLGDRFQALFDELKEPGLGTRALTEAFLKQAVVLVLRRQLRRNTGLPSWLDAFRDPSLAPAVSAILERPGHDFTLEDLAAKVGVSRSVFAERFTAAFGQSPIDFLKSVRLHRAARLLEVTALPVKVVAKSVGYESRSYFSRAFRAAYGVDPTDFRARYHIRALSDADLPLQ
jgi:AraC-like DNA-binding protein